MGPNCVSSARQTRDACQTRWLKGCLLELKYRSTRSVGLRADGRVFYKKAVPILNDLDDVHDMVTVSGCPPRGVLRLTAPEAFGQQVVLPVLGEFLAKWPDLD